jgi:hypothetical protein
MFHNVSTPLLSRPEGLHSTGLARAEQQGIGEEIELAVHRRAPWLAALSIPSLTPAP